MILRLKNNLFNSEFFWKYRKKASTLLFRLFRKLFGLIVSLKDFRLHNSIFLESIAEGAFYSIISLISVYFLNHYFPPLFNVFSDLSYKDLLTVVASISGVFLGLYFTAFSVVAGSLFKDITEDVRELFLSEKVGKQYIAILAFTTILSLVYLLIESVGYSLNPIVVSFITVFSIYVVIRIMALGFRTFYFFDPTILKDVVLGDIYAWLDSATRGHFQWRNKHFQNHYQKKAASSLRTYNNLIDFSSRNVQLFERQLVLMSRGLSQLLSYYLVKKRSIPSDSYWYEPIFKHKEWFATDSTEISLALYTKTSLYPKESRDKCWFEKQAIDAAYSITKTLIKNKKYRSAETTIEGYVELASNTGTDFNEVTSNLILEKSNEILEMVSKIESKDFFKEKLILIDSLTRIPIAFLLGFRKSVTYYREKPLNIEPEVYLKKKNIYSQVIPSDLLESLEFISERLFKEKEIEGKAITEYWYIQMQLVRSYLLLLQKYLEFLRKLHQAFFKGGFEKFSKNSDYILAAHFGQKWLEFSNKFENALLEIKKHTEDLRKYHRVRDLSWIEIDFETIENERKSLEKTVLSDMASLLPYLIDSDTAGEVPDYFGQTYVFVTNACYQACKDNDHETFGKIFPNLFVASLGAFDRTIKKTQGWVPESQIIFSSEWLIDLLEISGYAKIYSELYGNQEFWTVCKSYWDAYLNSDKGENFIKLIGLIVSVRDSTPTIKPRDILRIDYERGFKSKLVELNIISTDDFGMHSPFDDQEIEEQPHASKLISLIVRRGLILPLNGADIFFNMYLRKHPKAENNLSASRRASIFEEFDEEI